MTSAMKGIHVSIFLGFIACFIDAHGQQSVASSHFSASTSSSASTTNADVAPRRAGTRGTSTWGAGKGSFGYSAQPGGVWSDGTTLGAAPGTTHVTTQASTSSANALAPSLTRAQGSFSAKPSGAHGSAAFGATHLSHSYSTQLNGSVAAGSGSAARPSGMRHAVVGSRGRVVLLNRAASKGKTQSSSSPSSSMAKRAIGKEPAATSHLHSGLDTRLNR
jgi:hypothetical protein